MNRGWAWLGLGILLTSCTGEPPDDPPGDDGTGFYADAAPPTRDQSRELEALQSAGATLDRADFHPGARDLARLSGANLAPPGTPEDAARTFVAQHPALFRGAEIQPTSRTDAPEGALLYADQLAAGRRVLESGLAFRFDPDGSLAAVAGHTAAVGPLPDPALAADDALTRARAHAAALRPDLAGADASSPEPVVASTPQGPHGAWRVALDAPEAVPPTRLALLVDDQTGDLLGTEEELLALRGRGRGTTGAERDLEVTARGGAYYLVDPARGISTYRWTGELPGALVGSFDPDSWDTRRPAPGAAVDAHANAAVVADYLRDTLGRRGLDDRDGPIVSTVHYGHAFGNAFWNGAQMVYGDGDGQEFAPLSGGLEVVAHELFHGVSQLSPGLGRSGQAGAVNEAVSDAFASLLLAKRRDPNAWLIGATVYTPADPTDALRDLRDPLRLGQPDHLSLYAHLANDAAHDNGGVHRNATIAGHALYLMAEGGTCRTSGRTAPGVGRGHAEQILYRALTRHLPPRADFVQLARATEDAARELYGSRDAGAVRAAWEAVGVLVTPPATGAAGGAPGAEQEPNGTRPRANPVRPGDTVSGQIASATDRDVFRLDLPAAADLEVSLTGLSADLDLEILDAAGRRVARSEHDGAADEHLLGRAAAGTWYLRVLAAPGTQPANAPYRLQVR